MFDFISNWWNHGWDYASKSSKYEDNVENYENWTVQVAKDEQNAESVFQIKDENTHTEAEYNDDLMHFAKEYIERYDSDGNGQISMDEFVEKEVEQTMANIDKDELDEEALEAAKAQLKTVFDRLNVDKNTSKDGLDEKEIMNYFFSMDSMNDEFTADGSISKEEYIDMTLLLGGTQTSGSIEEYLKRNYNAYFKDYKTE